MASVNKVIILGNLGRDPEARTFPNGDMVTNVTIATTDKWKDKQTGEIKEATEWHRIVFSGRLAEIADAYLKKGDPVYVEGALRTRKYADKDGVEKYTTEIRAMSMQLLGGRRDGGGDRGENRPQTRPEQRPQQTGAGSRAPQRQPSTGFDDMDDDIPFVSCEFAHDAMSSIDRRKARYDCR